MHSLRKRYDAVFKAKVALEATKGEKTIAQLSSEFRVHKSPPLDTPQLAGGRKAEIRRR